MVLEGRHYQQGSQKRLSCVLLECLGTAVIGFKRADFTMTRDVHHAEDVGAVMQGRRDEACPQAVAREG